MRIIVTGGAGFIGSNLALTLQERHPDAEIIVIDDFSSGDWANLRGFKGDVLTHDMTDPGWTVALADLQVDQIYHIAANTDAREPNQLKMMRQNVEAFRYLLEFAAEASIPVVYATSAATYGIRDGVMRESDPTQPFSIYAFSKVAMEQLARIERERKGDASWKVVGVRYFNVFGPREAHKGGPASMIWHLYNQMKAGKRPRIFEHGQQTRDHVYVKDVVAGTINAMESKALDGVYNLGSGQARSFNDIVTVLNGILGTSLEPEYMPNPYTLYQHHTEADLTLSRKKIGYQPQFTLETGVADYVRWIESAPQ